MVPLNAMLVLSATTVSSGKGSVFFSTGTDSPVKEDSSVFKFIVSTILTSAGMRSPVLKTTMSPGTISLEGISCSFPLRITVAFGAAIF